MSMRVLSEAAGFTGAGLAGALAGAETIRRAGWKAAGMMGGGSGVGCPATRVGAVFGTLAGLSLYGLARTAAQVRKEAISEATEECGCLHPKIAGCDHDEQA